MADEIRLVTFEGENVAPVNDALMWDAAIGDSGVIYGCETTLKNASTLHIAAGYGVICGRHFQVFESDIPVTLSSTGDLLGRLYVHMDLSDATEPIQLLIETAASLTPEEQDDNINIINGVWDMNLATFAVNALTISNLQNVFSTVAGGGSSLIAGTETGATASQAYVAGQYIIWGSRLWEVIAPIASGDAFVIGSNLSATSTTVGNELTELNSSLDDIDIRYNAVSGKPEWRERGAGSFVPFSSSPIKSMIVLSYIDESPNYRHVRGFYINEDGGCGKLASTASISNIVDFLNNYDAATSEYESTGGSGVSYFKSTILKAGYYVNTSSYSYKSVYPDVVKYYNVGDVISGAFSNGGYSTIIYFGETNPFE